MSVSAASFSDICLYSIKAETLKAILFLINNSPIIGAGTYANNKTCAVSCTGEGELFIKNNIAFNVSALMEYKNMQLKDAADTLIYKILNSNTGGLISVDKDGNYAMPFNTNGMLRGVANSDGLFKVEVWKK